MWILSVRSVAGVASLFAIAAAGVAARSDDPPAKPASTAGNAPTATKTLPVIRDEIAGTALAIEMVPVTPKDGSKAFYIAKVETTWDLYDTFVFGFDQKAGKSTPDSDAVTRPTKPYISTDRGFGHAGYPAISVSFLGAKRFAEWLSAKTGRSYRLPTVAEWKAVCEASDIAPDTLNDLAWSADNSARKTHPVGSKSADSVGVHDLRGNVGEWCVGDDGKGVVLGGSFRNAPSELGCGLMIPYTPDWNASDPQFPKSKWWLADADFVGFRVVCDP